MADDISGFGFQVNLVASNTFPSGLNITQFADDTDPFDAPAVPIADVAMGLNGDLLRWSKASPLMVAIALIPGSDDDRNMQILQAANRVAAGKTSAQDEITLTGVYPDGQLLNLTGGVLTDAPFAPSIASSSRKKTNVYTFKFEGQGGAG